MRNTALDKPITMPEVCHTLHMWYDLDSDARERVFRSFGTDWDEANWHMQQVWEDLWFSVDWFMKESNARVVCESVHGPGTERFFPASDSSILTGWGVYRQFETLPNDWGICYQADIMDAWNKHVPTMDYLYNHLTDCIELEYNDAHTANATRPASWYEARYEETLENALNDVCDALNKVISSEEEYTWTIEFFEERFIDCSDDEMWFTSDGENVYRRDPSGLYNVDTCEEVDIIYESRKQSVLYVREYV